MGLHLRKSAGGVEATGDEHGETMIFGQMAQQPTMGWELIFENAVDEKARLQLSCSAVVGLQKPTESLSDNNFS